MAVSTSNNIAKSIKQTGGLKVIISLVLTGRHSIGIDTNGWFKVGTKKVNIKEVPFVRYRFESFCEDEVDYIRQMMSTFKFSTHLAEVNIKDGFDEQVRKLNDTFENLAIFLYMPVYDNHVESCEMTEADIELLEKIDEDIIYDRIILKDLSNSLHSVSANKLKNSIAEVTGFSASEMGICNSPLSIGNDACLTALRARTLASMYDNAEDCALPSANHESMNCCGCIKYFKVEADIKAPVDKGSKTYRSIKAKAGLEDAGGDENNDKKAVKTTKRPSKKIIKAW